MSSEEIPAANQLLSQASLHQGQLETPLATVNMVRYGEVSCFFEVAWCVCVNDTLYTHTHTLTYGKGDFLHTSEEQRVE